METQISPQLIYFHIFLLLLLHFPIIIFGWHSVMVVFEFLPFKSPYIDLFGNDLRAWCSEFPYGILSNVRLLLPQSAWHSARWYKTLYFQAVWGCPRWELRNFGLRHVIRPWFQTITMYMSWHSVIRVNCFQNIIFHHNPRFASDYHLPKSVSALMNLTLLMWTQIYS